eukprot:30850-Pelagococcus_subviridis.AAC.26
MPVVPCARTPRRRSVTDVVPLFALRSRREISPAGEPRKIIGRRLSGTRQQGRHSHERGARRSRERARTLLPE